MKWVAVVLLVRLNTENRGDGRFSQGEDLWLGVSVLPGPSEIGIDQVRKLPYAGGEGWSGLRCYSRSCVGHLKARCGR